MQNLLTNWKTTLAGVAVIGLNALHLVGVNVPGFTPMDIGTAVVVGGGLILSGDAALSAKFHDLTAMLGTVKPLK